MDYAHKGNSVWITFAGIYYSDFKIFSSNPRILKDFKSIKISIYRD